MILEERLKEGCIIKVFYDKDTGEYVTRVTDKDMTEGRSPSLFNSVESLIKTYEMDKFLDSKSTK